MIKRLTNFFITRTFVMIVVVTIVLVALFCVEPGDRTQAAPVKCSANGVNVGCVSLPVWTYYTDATKTVACGSMDWCSTVAEGCVTPYKTSQRFPCNCGDR
jgi:hypothetical protein